MKCANGKYKYGERGACVFDSLEACHAAEAAIHARETAVKPEKSTKDMKDHGTIKPFPTRRP
jgi:hypothetical protein